MFAPQVAARGVPVAEFNLEATSATNSFGLDLNNYSNVQSNLKLINKLFCV